MLPLLKIASLTSLLVIAGCASLPNGPNVIVLPGTGVSFQQFRTDDTTCEGYAYTQVGGKIAGQATVNNEPASGTTAEIQERYDVAYVQCMYAKGHQVPVSGPFSDVVPHKVTIPATPIPAPPPGLPPPPPGAPSTELQQ